MAGAERRVVTLRPPDYSLRPRRARGRDHAPHAAAAAQLAAQPDRQGVLPRPSSRRSPRSASSTTSSRSPTRSTSTSTFDGASTSRSRRCRACATARSRSRRRARRSRSPAGRSAGCARPAPLLDRGAHREAVPHLRERRAVPVRDRHRARAPRRASTGSSPPTSGAGATSSAPASRPPGFTVFRPSGTYFVTTDIRPLGETDGLAFCRDAARAVRRGRGAERRSSTTTRTPAARSCGSRSASAPRCSTRRSPPRDSLRGVL